MARWLLRRLTPSLRCVAVLGAMSLAGCSLLVGPNAEKIPADGAGGAGGSGGAGGEGSPCASADECLPAASACLVVGCVEGVCASLPLPEGPATSQTEGDCAVVLCDGAGMESTAVDDSDVPKDALDCTVGRCDLGVPTTEGAPAGAPCDDLGGTLCDGGGLCVACLAATDCGESTECRSVSCEAGACVGVDAPSGTPLAAQTSFDCKLAVCDGAGGETTEVDDADLPFDGLACTEDLCSQGTPSHPFSGAGTPCAEAGGTVCSGAGACVECADGSHCATGVCQSNTCQDPSCGDLVQNGDETATDCGGSCGPCPLGETCAVDADCQTGRCAGVCGPVEVASVSPLDGSSGAPVEGPITVVFSGAMDPSSLTLKTALDSGPCAGTLQVSTDAFATCVPMSAAQPAMSGGATIATLTPAPGLAFGSTFRVRLVAGALDAQGDAPVPFSTPQGFTTRFGIAGAPVAISQVYGGGGNPGAPLSHDFVELKNRGPGSIDLAGYSLQYASAGGTTWSTTPLAGVVAPGGYWLVQLGSGGPSGAPLPAPDHVGLVNLSSSSGKLALVAPGVTLGGSCPVSPAIVDMVGYGAASCAEGPTPAPGLTVASALFRAADGCVDADASAADFSTATPAPRSSASPSLACALSVANESGLGEVDLCAVVSPVSLSLSPGAASGPVVGRVYEVGVTEPPGADAAVTVEIGFGPRTSNPQHEAGWQWSAASFVAQAGNADEYAGAFTAPAPGSYSYTVRVSLDGGASHTYCDLDDAGSSVGAAFETPQLPALTVN